MQGLWPKPPPAPPPQSSPDHGRKNAAPKARERRTSEPSSHRCRTRHRVHRGAQGRCTFVGSCTSLTVRVVCEVLSEYVMISTTVPWQYSTQSAQSGGRNANRRRALLPADTRQRHHNDCSCPVPRAVAGGLCPALRPCQLPASPRPCPLLRFAIQSPARF